MLTRRQILALGMGAAGSAAVAAATRRFPLARAETTPRRTGLAPPRYHVKLFMPGGIDSIYSMDPKLSAEVEDGIDVPYKPTEIVTAGDIKLGPHFAPLAKWAPQLTIVKGVAVSTANHNTGHAQALRLRTKTTNAMPSIFEILGAHRDGQPLGSVTLGPALLECHTSGWFGQPGPLFGAPENRLLRHVDAASPEDLRMLGKVLSRQARKLRRRNQPSEVLTAGQNLADTAAFFQRVADLPRFEYQPWDGIEDGYDVPDMMERLQRTLWLIENDLTSSAFVSVVGSAANWDTHTDNTRRQTAMNSKFIVMLDRFLTEMEKRSNAHGRLIDNTVIIVASELGRFPYLNAATGKDHFPEAPFMFMGPWFPGGKSFGQTGKQMEAMPIDTASGRGVRSGGHRVRVDDLGSTILALSGIDPELYGYNGKTLDFLLGA